MDKPLRKTTFDEADRAHIRAALHRYMEEHGIGVPTLLKRIANVTGRHDDLVPQKTLQRFLEGVMRTNDLMVGIFYEFVQTLPPQPNDELGDMADSLSAFYNPAAEQPSTASPIRAPVGLNGIVDETSMSFITIDKSRAGRSYTPVEELIQPRFDSEGSSWNKHRYEGVLQARGNFFIVFLRSNLTRLPRIHWLTQNPDGTFQSVCQYEKFRASPESPIGNDVLTLRPLHDQQQ